MDKRHLFWLTLLTLFLGIPVTCFSQKIENVVSEVSDNSIHIYYDLLEIAVDQPVIIRVFVSTDGGQSYGEPLKSVIGDVGLVVGAGERKHIIWNVFEEVDELVGESVTFKVKADLLQSEPQRPALKPVWILNLNSNIGWKVDQGSYGFNMKIAVYFKQLGVGIRGVYYETVGEKADVYVSNYYTGFGGGAVVEYDLIRNPKYSLYPFFYLGQTKIQHYNEDSPEPYSGYSIFYTPGLGLDIRLLKFLYLGIELEYYLAPVIDLKDEGGTVAERIVMDGFCGGIALKFVLPSRK